jgi:telomerase reverse transcriptase
VPNTAPEPQISERFTDYASTAGQVSGFVKAVIKRVIPYDFFGSGSNQRLVLQMVDRFIKLRRYESFSLHDVLQGLKVCPLLPAKKNAILTSLIQLTDFTWLRPSSLRPEAKLSKTDEAKRRELLAEFLYWLFDSFIIPLLRAHFYITESGVDRNRVFYFRHDVWKRLSEPALESLKLNLFQELPREEGAGRQTLGFSTVRLLPKESGVRPIMNLGKRGMVVVCMLFCPFSPWDMANNGACRRMERQD